MAGLWLCKYTSAKRIEWVYEVWLIFYNGNLWPGGKLQKLK